LVTTLACEQALIEENWSEAQALLDLREELLSSLDGLSLTEEATLMLRKTAEAEERVIQALQAARSRLVSESARSTDQQRAAAAYRRAA
jgi:hypothetical protein